MIVIEIIDVPRCVDTRAIGSSHYGSRETVRTIVHAKDGWRPLTWEPWQLIDWDGSRPNLPLEEGEAPPATTHKRVLVKAERSDLPEVVFDYFPPIVARRGEQIVEETTEHENFIDQRILRVSDGIETIVCTWRGTKEEAGKMVSQAAQDVQRIVHEGERYLAASGVEMERHTFFGLEDQIVGRPGEIVEERLNLGDRVRRRVLRVRDGVETVVAEWVLPS
jgi:hypothetical protein